MKPQNQQQAPNTVGNFFKGMKILFGAFILGVVNFGIVILALFFLDELPLTSLPDEYLIYLIAGDLAFLLIMSLIADKVYSNKVEKVKDKTGLGIKITAFREAKLIQICLLEAVALISLVFLLLYTHVAFVVFSVISIIQMIRYYPNKERMIAALNLSYDEQQKLNDPDYLLD